MIDRVEDPRCCAGKIVFDRSSHESSTRLVKLSSPIFSTALRSSTCTCSTSLDRISSHHTSASQTSTLPLSHVISLPRSPRLVTAYHSTLDPAHEGDRAQQMCWLLLIRSPDPTLWYGFRGCAVLLPAFFLFLIQLLQGFPSRVFESGKAGGRKR